MNTSMGMKMIFFIILVATIILKALPYMIESHKGVNVRFMPKVTNSLTAITLGNVIFFL